MDALFPYSKHVSGKHFVGRKNDVALLGNLISQGEHVCIYEPPKTGKTSLIRQALLGMQFSGTSFMVCQISVLTVRTVTDFILSYGRAVMKMAASTPDGYAGIVEKYLSGTHFVFDQVAYSDRGEVLSLNWEPDRGDAAAIFRLPFLLSESTPGRIVIICDDFHCVSLLDNPDGVLVPLSACLKTEAAAAHRKCSLVFCGSGVNAMHDIFRRSLLFHRIVERVRLSPIDPKALAENASKGFLSGGKVITKELMDGAIALFQGHPWYVNHFFALCDSMARGYILAPVLDDALDCLISVHEPRFRDIMNSLTTHQVNFLKCCLDGVTRFTSADVIRQYDLHSSANVKRVKEALMKKEVLLFTGEDSAHVQDPLFEYWVKKYYFKMI